MPDGQRLFEDLLHLHPVIGNSEGLEDLRYRWMLYKSKLRESMSSPVGDSTQSTAAELCHCSPRLLHIAGLNSTVHVCVLNEELYAFSLCKLCSKYFLKWRVQTRMTAGKEAGSWGLRGVCVCK